jgi:glucokinase
MRQKNFLIRSKFMTIVFDIGGSNMRIGRSGDGQTVEDMQKTNTPKTFEAGLPKFIEIAEALANGQPVTKIAGGIAGLVDKNSNELTASLNLSDWANKDFAGKLSAHFNCPAVLENDAALGAVGEAVYGAGKNKKSVAYFGLGTGIGGAWVVNGELQNHNGTFEPGHQYISTTGGQDLEQMVDAVESAEDKEKYLAIGIHNALMFWPVEIVVIGGGKIIHNNISIENIKKHIVELTPSYQYNIEIAKTDLGDEAGLYGALSL